MTKKTQKWLRVGTTAPATSAGYSRWLKDAVTALTRQMRTEVAVAGGKVLTEPHFDLRLTMHQLVEVDAVDTEETV